MILDYVYEREADLVEVSLIFYFFKVQCFQFFFFEVVDQTSRSKKRKVAASPRGDLKISLPSSETISGQLTEINGDECDEQELMELQLRLEALQSTMKGDGTDATLSTNERSKSGGRSEKPAGNRIGSRRKSILREPSVKLSRSAGSRRYSRSGYSRDSDDEYRNRERPRYRRERAYRSFTESKSNGAKIVPKAKKKILSETSSKTVREFSRASPKMTRERILK